MRGVGIAGVTQARDDLSGLHLVTRFHEQRPLLQVRVRRPDAAPEVLDDVVPVDGLDGDLLRELGVRRREDAGLVRPKTSSVEVIIAVGDGTDLWPYPA